MPRTPTVARPETQPAVDALWRAQCQAIAASYGLQRMTIEAREWERERDETDRRLVELAADNPYRIAGIAEGNW